QGLTSYFCLGQFAKLRAGKIHGVCPAKSNNPNSEMSKSRTKMFSGKAFWRVSTLCRGSIVVQSHRLHRFSCVQKNLWSGAQVDFGWVKLSERTLTNCFSGSRVNWRKRLRGTSIASTRSNAQFLFGPVRKSACGKNHRVCAQPNSNNPNAFGTDFEELFLRQQNEFEDMVGWEFDNKHKV